MFDMDIADMDMVDIDMVDMDMVDMDIDIVDLYIIFHLGSSDHHMVNFLQWFQIMGFGIFLW